MYEPCGGCKEGGETTPAEDEHWRVATTTGVTQAHGRGDRPGTCVRPGRSEAPAIRRRGCDAG